MTMTFRRIAVLLAAAVLSLCGVTALAAPAQAAPVPVGQSSNVVPTPSPRPTTMFIYNSSGRTIQVSVFARIESMHNQTLAAGEVWQLPETFTAMNEISVRIPDDPNYAFLGHFGYDSGAFHFLDARAHNISYNVIGGRNHGIAFTPAP